MMNIFSIEYVHIFIGCVRSTQAEYTENTQKRKRRQDKQAAQESSH